MLSNVFRHHRVFLFNFNVFLIKSWINFNPSCYPHSLSLSLIHPTTTQIQRTTTTTTVMKKNKKNQKSSQDRSEEIFLFLLVYFFTFLSRSFFLTWLSTLLRWMLLERGKSLMTAIFQTLDQHKSWEICFTIVLNYVIFMPFAFCLFVLNSSESRLFEFFKFTKRIFPLSFPPLFSSSQTKLRRKGEGKKKEKKDEKGCLIMQ